MTWCKRLILTPWPSALFGRHRLVFGSNFPVNLPSDHGEGCRRLLAHVTRHHASIAEDLLWRTAMELY